MKLYQTYTSPFPTRVRLALYAKGLACEIIEPPGFHATPESKGDYMRINPIGRVPTLITDDGRALPESEVICEYLEDAYPDPPTLPPDPWGRAQVRLISRLCDFYLVMAMRPLFTASGQSRKRWDRAAIDAGLAAGDGARLHRAPSGRRRLRGRRSADLGRRGAAAAADAFLRVGAESVRRAEPAWPAPEARRLLARHRSRPDRRAAAAGDARRRGRGAGKCPRSGAPAFGLGTGRQGGLDGGRR